MFSNFSMPNEDEQKSSFGVMAQCALDKPCEIHGWIFELALFLGLDAKSRIEDGSMMSAATFSQSSYALVRKPGAWRP